MKPGQLKEVIKSEYKKCAKDPIYFLKKYCVVQHPIKGKVPLLGVCLGHEVIGQVFGGKIVKVAPMHGKTSIVENNGSGIFKDIPKEFIATRYHSLVIEKESLPECLSITAKTQDGLIMGVEHKEYPIFGVQFHPESIASEYGHELLNNFIRLCK